VITALEWNVYRGAVRDDHGRRGWRIHPLHHGRLDPAASSPTYQAAIPLNSLTTVQAMAIAPNYANSAVASATFKFQTPSGAAAITITPTVTPSGSSKQLPLTPILLTLNVQ